jgi:hypothetical protein
MRAAYRGYESGLTAGPPCGLSPEQRYTHVRVRRRLIRAHSVLAHSGAKRQSALLR